MRKIRKPEIKIIICVSLVLLFLLPAASLYSLQTFHTANPFSAAAGLLKITFTDAEYAEIQSYPKVIVAKTTASLDLYMQEQGFRQEKDDQMGALLVYSNDCTKDYILFSQNRYFSQWRRQE